MPDDGEWECVDISGVAYCHSRGELAGMPSGPPDIGWLCGARRAGAAGERICVDFDADRPSDATTAQRCRYELQHGIARRSCTRASASSAAVGCSDPISACRLLREDRAAAVRNAAFARALLDDIERHLGPTK